MAFSCKLSGTPTGASPAEFNLTPTEGEKQRLSLSTSKMDIDRQNLKACKIEEFSVSVSPQYNILSCDMQVIL